MKMQKPSVRIEDWAVVPGLNTASYQVLGEGNLLVGKVFGHPRIGEGAFIVTSPILSLDSESKAVTTRNTVYCLGQASRDYEQWTRARAA